MCGLVAYYAYHRAAVPVDRAAARRVAAAMRPRGPDGEGSWHGHEGRVHLGHTRLAVIAPGPQGAQPMISGDGALVLTYNGEIYNHHTLRVDLEARGHRFVGDSDTEVVLAMYREYGEDMLGRLRGMFAFAIWDSARGELFLARDAYGIKPLYYADDGWTFRAASQVKALQRDEALDAAPCPAGWAGYYLFGSVPEPFTTRRAVRALPAGCAMRVGPSGPGVPRRWFSLTEVLGEPSRAPATQTVREAVLASVVAHLVADVPVGLFLSAGLDSGMLLALACERGMAPRTITLAFDEFTASADDETGPAREAAERYGARHTVRRVGVEEFEADLPLILAAMDQPSIDGVNTWFASKAAAELGLKVALSGVGADELFGGYPSFRQLPWLAGLTRWPARIPGLATASRCALQPLVRRAGLHPKLAGVLAAGGGYPGAYMLRRGLFMPWELPGLMGAGAARQGLENLAPLGLLENLITPDPGTPHTRVTALESGAYLRNQLLRDADWAGMAHGVEIRTPLVDRVLVQTLAPTLRAWPPGQGKAMLAQVPARRLPRSVTARPKTGFSVPLEKWLARRAHGTSPHLPPHVATMRHWAQYVAGSA